jgi:bifunctional non-homologous end joining protein LigD
LRALPLVERKAALRALLARLGRAAVLEHFEAQGEALFAEAERLGLEGIIGKRAASPYVSKRSTDWIKDQRRRSRTTFVVVGYLPPKQGGKGFGALLLAQYPRRRADVRGRAGSGFAARDFAALEPLLAAKPRAEPPLRQSSRAARCGSPTARSCK